MNRLPYIYVHADDYGMTQESCGRIFECWEKGCLNSVSIMPNGCLNYAVDNLKKTDMDCVVHINIVEGKPISPYQHLDLLVNEKGFFKNDFFSLLMLSMMPGKRKRLKQQIYLEIKAQILEIMKCLPKGSPLLLDSHQHIHMIPLIFHTLMEVIEECKISVEYLRIPAEPLMPFFMEPALYKTYKPINIIKNLVLNFLWIFNRKTYKKAGIKSALFCGIIFSGNMDEDRVIKVFPHFYKIAQKRKCDLEFLFHPGFIEKDEMFLDPDKDGFTQFYLSEGRKREGKTICSERFKDMVQVKK